MYICSHKQFFKPTLAVWTQGNALRCCCCIPSAPILVPVFPAYTKSSLFPDFIWFIFLLELVCAAACGSHAAVWRKHLCINKTSWENTCGGLRAPRPQGASVPPGLGAQFHAWESGHGTKAEQARVSSNATDFSHSTDYTATALPGWIPFLNAPASGHSHPITCPSSCGCPGTLGFIRCLTCFLFAAADPGITHSPTQQVQ